MRRYRVVIGYGLQHEREIVVVRARNRTQAELKALEEAEKWFPHREREPDVIRIDLVKG